MKPILLQTKELPSILVNYFTWKAIWWCNWFRFKITFSWNLNKQDYFL